MGRTHRPLPFVPRRWALHLGVALLVVAAFMMVAAPARAGIDAVSLNPLIGEGDTGGAQVSVTSEGGSCLTATVSDPGILIGVNPGCTSAGTPVFSLTVIVDAGVPAGTYPIAVREFDAAQNQLLAASDLSLQVTSDTAPTTTMTTSTTAAPTTTEVPETAAIQPADETGLSPFLTILAFAVLGTLVWMLVRARGGGARVKYRRLVDPERLATIHRTFRDAGQGAPAAIRNAGTSSSKLDVAITPLAGPEAPVDVEVLTGAPWSRQRARVVAMRTDGAMQLQVQRGEAGLADVPDGEAAAQTWLDGLASDLEVYGDGRGSAAIRRWLNP